MNDLNPKGSRWPESLWRVMRSPEGFKRALKRWTGFCAVFPLILIAESAGGACVLDVAEGGRLDPSLWIQRVSARSSQVPAGHLRITFSGHSSFLIETPGGASIFTDYNARNLPPVRPDAVTMSNPHDTHSAESADFPLVLRGWNPSQGLGTPRGGSPR